MENISFSYITRGNADPRGKAKVYFCYHPEDRGYLEHIAGLLLKKQDCAVYYYDYEKNGEPDWRELVPLLSEMQLLVIPVTAKFLDQPNLAFDFELPYAMGQHIPVLPLLQNSDLAVRFSKKCGNLQALDEFDQDKTVVSFDEKLERFLSDVLISAEMTQRIQAAFDTYVFLSYRKKDRAYAQELMRLIHKNPLCRDIAIWYDEFLTAGEPYDKAIQAALEKSELFTVLVTPNLVNEQNYVMDIEFPEAKKAGKDILAAESVPTDREALKEKFPGLPDCVDAKDAVKLPAELLAKLKRIAIAENNTPEHTFLIGLAYLGGIDVEKNTEMAVSLITGAAAAGLPEAMKKLADMYYNGTGVGRDIHCAVQWQEKYVASLDAQWQQLSESGIEEGTDISIGEPLFWERQSLVEYYEEAGQIRQAEAALLENASFAEELADLCPGWYLDYAGFSYENAVVFYRRLGSAKGVEFFLEKALAFWKERVTEAPETGKEAMARTYINAGNYYSDQNRPDKAEQFFRDAIGILEELEAKDPTRYRGELASGCYNIGLLYYDQAQNEEAEEMLGRAVAHWKELAAGAPGQYKEKLATGYQGMANLYIRLNRAEEAKELLLKALEINEELAEKNPERHSMDIAMNYANLATIPDLPPEQHEEYLLNADGLLRALIPVNPIGCSHGLAINCSNLALFYRSQGRWDEEEAYCLEAIRLQKTLAEENPDRFGGELATIYMNAGGFYDMHDKPEQAEAYLMKAVDVLEALFVLNPQRHSERLMEAYTRIMILYPEQDREDKWDELMLRYMGVMEKVYATDPQLYAGALDDCCYRIGESYAGRGRHEDARECFLKCVTVREAMAEAEPGQHNAFLGSGYHNMAVCCYFLEQWKTAMEYSWKALRIREPLAEEDPVLHGTDLVESYSDMGLICTHQGQMEEALAYYNKSTDLLRQLPQQGDAEYMERFEQAARNVADLRERLGISD